MNTVEGDLDKLVVTVTDGRMGMGLKILAGIARWTWRGCSIVLFLCAAPFLLLGLPQGIKNLLSSSDWSIGDVMMFAGIGIYLAGLAVAWRREGLGALVICLALVIPTLIGLIQGQHDDELIGYVVWALTLLVMLSWALNTLKNANAEPCSRRAAIVLAPLLVIGIGFCIYCMPGSKFNP